MNVHETGSEFRSQEFRRAVQATSAQQRFIRAGRPQTNGCAERIQRTILEEHWRPSFVRYRLWGQKTPDDHGKHDAEEQKQPIFPADATSGCFGGVELRLKLHHLRTGQRAGVFANSIISRSRTAISACSSNVNGVLSTSTKRAPVRISPSRSRSAQRSGVSTSRLTSSAHRRTSSSTFAQLKASDSLAGLSPTITFAVVKGRGALLARHSSTSSRGMGPRPASTWCPRGLRSASTAAAMPERRSSA